MKHFMTILIFIVVQMSTAWSASARTDPVKPQTKCPILGDKIDKSVHLDYKSKRVYFCCPGCMDKFKKKADRYLKIMESKGIQLEKALPQTLCPVMGGKIDKEVFVDYKGKRIYFCCPGCDRSFNESPDKYIKEMESKGIALARAVIPQTVCPVMGGKINKEVFADYKDKRVYFCCPGCDAAFNESPDKYIRKMEAKGITLDRTPGKHEDREADNTDIPKRTDQINDDRNHDDHGSGDDQHLSKESDSKEHRHENAKQRIRPVLVME